MAGLKRHQQMSIMSNLPLFSFFLADKSHSVSDKDPLWYTALPLKRTFASDPPIAATANSVTYGDYFSATSTFLARDRFGVIAAAAAQKERPGFTPDSIKAVQIFLTKHGEFYHPAKIDVYAGDATPLALVLNVAVSPNGQNVMHSEYHLLQRLQSEFPFRFTPRVYGFDNIHIKDGVTLPMFLAEWFEDYCEFHISCDPADGSHQIVVWDPARGPFYLSPDQRQDLYRQAALILTSYYNAETFDQIFPWHHAAGDFVIKTTPGRLDVKLITVRKYAPLFQQPTASAEVEQYPALILEALLVFLLTLLLRMRLDRIDGVGEITWAGEEAIKGAVAGVFEALALKPPLSSSPIPLADGLGYVLNATSKSELYDLSMSIAEALHPGAPEMTVIKQHLRSHIHTLVQLD